MAHFAHYIKRTLVEPNYVAPEDRYYIENQPDDQGFYTPTFHAAPANSGVAKRVNVGDTIWLFSQLSSSWDTLPPALDAIVTVARISKPSQDGATKYRFAAGAESKWMPLFDASRLLARLNLVDASGMAKPLMGKRTKTVGQALRFMREVYDPTPFLQHQRRIEAMKPDFVSYRLIDGTRPAFALTTRLLCEHRAVFWDRWSLPRRLAERREFLRHRTLDAFIRQSIQDSRVVHGVCTPLYAEYASYSRKEWQLADSLGKFAPYFHESDG